MLSDCNRQSAGENLVDDKQAAGVQPQDDFDKKFGEEPANGVLWLI
jgi:hypothetical protein